MPQIEDRPSFIIESWTLYVFGTLILFSRFAVRFKTVGWRGLQGDDFFSFLVLIFYAIDAFTVHLIYYLGTNIEAGVAAKSHSQYLSDFYAKRSELIIIKALTKDEIHEYETGSKLELAAWYAYTALIWSLKGTMLCFFSRMTIGTWHNMFVKTVSILCALSYLAVFLTITFGCFPTQKNWQVVPDPGEKCSFKMQNFLVTTVLNVLTDALILGIPMPLLWKLQVPFRKSVSPPLPRNPSNTPRKLVIGLLLSSGAFVIAAAITRVVLTLSANPSALTINAWGVRETIVGILTVNIPILRPIFSKSFWNGNAPSELTSSYRTTTHGTRGGNRTLTQDISGPYELTPSINDGTKPSTEVHNDTYAAISPSNFDLDGATVLIAGASRGLGLAMAISFAKAGASHIAIGARSDLSSSSASIIDAASKAGRKRPTVLELNLDVEGGETVVNVSSIGAHCVSPTLSGYQISKLATLRLAEFATANVATDMVLHQWPQSPELSKAFADKPELAGDSIVYLTSEKRDWLAGRYVNAKWDLPELMEKK
ncbi:integral membrane protein PTH11 [Fusarium napiforme]|uniref:Integral membrane protein PTH11 n=1 Tax=Fusarium napiforme TaxID=42672 RepID=A0A8H5K5C1_9HYPO|nr:integral membrane protein PTH11 [Fusarium napiforme]